MESLKTYWHTFTTTIYRKDFRSNLPVFLYYIVSCYMDILIASWQIGIFNTNLNAPMKILQRKKVLLYFETSQRLGIRHHCWIKADISEERKGYVSSGLCYSPNLEVNLHDEILYAGVELTSVKDAAVIRSNLPLRRPSNRSSHTKRQ